MSLTKDDLKAIKQIIDTVEERLNGKIEQSISDSEQRLNGKIEQSIADSEERLIESIEQLTLLTGQGFNEVHEKLELLDEKIENVKNIVSAEIKRVDKHESIIATIRKQLRAV